MELKDFELAQERLQNVLHHTELDLSSTFSAMSGGKIYLKCENRQKTGSFKIRGAGNKLAAMAESGEKRPVVAASAGNHAQGVAYAAKRFGIPATIVMPKTAPLAKIRATEDYGAKVVLWGDGFDDAFAKACEICREEGAAFVHAYNDEEVIAGQGTLGLEILSDLPSVDIVVVPTGGGGLLAGIATAIKDVNPRVKVYGVQAEHCDPLVRSFHDGHLIVAESAATIADGIAVKTPGDLTFDLIQRNVDGMVTVSDTEIADAILLLLERCKQVVEPSGATSLAAVLNGRIDVSGKRVVCVLSGGNIDVSFIQSIIERGLVARHRRIKFVVTLLDKPGSLMQMLSVISESGANILQLEHDKISETLNPNETNVHVSLEVGGEEHGNAVLNALKEKGYSVEYEI